MTRVALASLIQIPLLLTLAALYACGGGGSPAPPLGAVEAVTATAEDRAVLVSWTSQGAGVGYRVFFSNDFNFDPGMASFADVLAPPFLQDGLENGVMVFYRVAATAGGTVGPVSAEVQATPVFQADPLFKDQWHLSNTGQGNGTPGEDANVSPAWDAGFEGSGVVIAIVDDGLEIAHEDLMPNVLPGESFDYVDGDTDPTRGRHGTSCAGIAAARAGNGIGVSGSAPRAQLVGFNFLADSTVANQADAMVRGLSVVHISSNSWGPPDSTGDLGYPPTPWTEAVQQGLSQGRGGLGLLYVFAAGNGHLGPPGGLFGIYDNTNTSGFATNPGVIVIGAVDPDGVRSVYSERGASLWICAPSARTGQPPSPVNIKISTTDRTGAEGYNDATLANEYADPNYTRGFDGTSASTPLVSGVIALVLQANPALGWRDVRELLAATARQNDPGHADWLENAAGHLVNHDYGFGVIDAGAAVLAAPSWTPLGPKTVHVQPPIEPGLAIPDIDAQGVTLNVPVTGSGITHLEYVELVFTSDHPFPPDLEIVLTSPNSTGTENSFSVLAVPHDTTEKAPQTLDAWRFGSARHFGEPADGTWTLRVADHAAVDIGEIQRVQIVLHGR